MGTRLHMLLKSRFKASSTILPRVTVLLFLASGFTISFRAARAVDTGGIRNYLFWQIANLARYLSQLRSHDGLAAPLFHRMAAMSPYALGWRAFLLLGSN